MKTKKFEAATEQEALDKVKQELGSSAVVLSIRNKPARGLLKLFKKPSVEMTATYEDYKIIPKDSDKDFEIARQQKYIRELEYKLQGTKDMFTTLSNQLTVEERENEIIYSRFYSEASKYENQMIQTFYDLLTAKGVYPPIAEKILEEANALNFQSKDSFDVIAKLVNNKILEILGKPKHIIGHTDNQIAIFMGPTGSGKTTTIAKLATILHIEEDKKLGLISSDTYRIAAAEQLRSYADIIGLDFRTVQDAGEITATIERLQESSKLILIDTAGRSHRNTTHLEELRLLLENTPNSDKFLLISANTSHEDILAVIKAYSSIAEDLSLIFTKMDEAKSLGTIVNISYLSGRQVSYITNGQRIPEDISVMRADKIAEELIKIDNNTGGGGSI